MVWPNKLAFKITAQFFNFEYSDDPRHLLVDNPQLKELNYFNPNATPEAKRITAHRVAAELLTHMIELNIELEEEGNLDTAWLESTTFLANGNKRFVDIGEVIDFQFKFVDETE